MLSMQKRMAVLFCLIIAGASVLFFRLYYLTAGDALSTAAKTQSSYQLDVLQERGIIYDHRFQRLTNAQERYVAAVMPCPQALSELSRVLTGDKRAQMIESFQDNRPFLLELDSPDVYAYGVDVFTTTQRYSENQPAAHIVGHLSDGKGAYGIEKAYDDILADCGAQVSISYAVDALASPLTNIPPSIHAETSAQGVVLTLDLDIQRIVEEVSSYYIKKGAVVVMDAHTGDIRAALSLPAFSPTDVSASLNSPENPFVNRVMSAFNVGSTFKIVNAACALDSGFSTELGYECVGAIEIDGVVFRCHNTAGHGWVTMQRAMEQSCNPYFISLGLKQDPRRLLNLCEAVGLSRQTKLAPQMITAPGNIPSIESLVSRAELGNFAFGQGTLTATPLQVAAFVSSAANGGMAVTPRLVAGATEDGGTLSSENPSVAPVRVMSPSTAAILHDMLVSTVEKGSGLSALPDFGKAGGKTGSAQTGIYMEGGREIVHAWFSGFYPAEEPKYTIVVLNEGGNSGGKVAAPVFKGIADGIAALGRE